jgi:outer membrane protein assembly factor BamB
VAVGQDPEHGEGVGNLTCIDATKTGDITKTGKIWSYDKVHRSISTVSIDPDTGLLFIGDFSGFIHCLDAETGKLYWTHDMKAHIWGSTLVADGKLYAGDEDGDFVVMAASKEKKLISETNLRLGGLWHSPSSPTA